MQIGGHKWKLFGIINGENVFVSGDIYDNNMIGIDLEYRLNFNVNGNFYAVVKKDSYLNSYTGTWWSKTEYYKFL